MVTSIRLAACVLGCAALGFSAPNTGRELFEKHCIACHAKDGSGGHGGANLRAAMKYGTDVKSVSNVIKHGVPSNGMPSFADRGPDEIRKIALYVLQLHKQGQADSMKSQK